MLTSFCTIFSATEFIWLKMKMPKDCFHILFPFSHFLGIKNEDETKNKLNQVFR